MQECEIVELARRMIERYYENDIQPFLEVLDEHVMWIGPAQGQVIAGRDNLLAAFAADQHNLRFETHNITVTVLPSVSPQVFDVVLTLLVDTLWPTGRIGRVDQRISLTIVEDDKGPRILLCHISNAMAYDERDLIYPTHYAESFKSAAFLGDAHVGRMCLSGLRGSTLYLDAEHIVYVEAKDRHALVHTMDGNYESSETVEDINRSYPGLFLPCHQNYLVNPDYVFGIARYKLLLSTGAKVPVPAAKYDAVRAALIERGNITEDEG